MMYPTIPTAMSAIVMTSGTLSAPDGQFPLLTRLALHLQDGAYWCLKIWPVMTEAMLLHPLRPITTERTPGSGVLFCSGPRQLITITAIAALVDVQKATRSRAVRLVTRVWRVSEIMTQGCHGNDSPAKAPERQMQVNAYLVSLSVLSAMTMRPMRAMVMPMMM